MPTVKFPVRLDLEQKPSFLERHWLENVIFPKLYVIVENVCSRPASRVANDQKLLVKNPVIK